jgi:hypothetical protein
MEPGKLSVKKYFHTLFPLLNPALATGCLIRISGRAVIDLAGVSFLGGFGCLSDGQL